MVGDVVNSEKAMQEDSIARKFMEVFDIGDCELRALSHSKRFLERWIADESFRASILSDAVSLNEAAVSCGCDVDIETLLPVFHPDYVAFRPTATSQDWPLTVQWDRYIKKLLEIRDCIPLFGGTNGLNPQFDIWRNRNINRAALQLDVAAAGITHPPVAFELSSGCSVGCWFCGISADEFKGHATLANGGAREWKKTLEAVKAVIGDGIQCGFCYWATDPLDNPEYMSFLKIYEEVVGCIPQTTTAIPLRNVDLTREVLDLWKTRRSTPNRFSVMTKRQLLEIHKTFSPEDLFGVEIVLQTGDVGAVTKFASGRNFENQKNNRKSKEAFLDGTIACVSGFLINIVEKTVKLISPTMPTTQWPNGYIIYTEKKYKNSDDLQEILRNIVSHDAKANMTGSEKLQIASGGSYDRQRNPNAILFRRLEISNDFIGRVGERLSSGEHTPISITDACLKMGMNPLESIASLEKMWQEGVLDQALTPVTTS